MTEQATDADRVDLRFDEGLLPVIAQDATDGEVLMLAYASPAAVARTEVTGLAHYYSRSREEIWQKGETSGHVQAVQEIRVDCDGDALLYIVDQDGGACHTGHRSCFYRSVTDLDTDGEGAVDAGVEHVGERIFDPESVYGDD